MKPKIGLSEKKLEHINEVLAKVLSNEMMLYVKTRKFHWNVFGESFMEMHKLFENQYKDLETYIDGIAERITKLGGEAIGTMVEYIKISTIKESPGRYPGAKDMIKELLNDHETIIVELRKQVEICSDDYKDAGTADFLTGLMEEHETISWTLRRYLK